MKLAEIKGMPKITENDVGMFEADIDPGSMELTTDEAKLYEIIIESVLCQISFWNRGECKQECKELARSIIAEMKEWIELKERSDAQEEK